MDNWKIIDPSKINFTNIYECVDNLKKNNYEVSLWIENISLKYKDIYSKPKDLVYLYRLSLSDIGFKKPTELQEVYNEISKFELKLVDPFIAVYSRFIYDEQPVGEWLRFAVDTDSMVDTDNIPHLPKLGKALNKFFIETYWAYKEAIFHPHNEFVFQKKYNVI